MRRSCLRGLRFAGVGRSEHLNKLQQRRHEGFRGCGSGGEKTDSGEGDQSEGAQCSPTLHRLPHLSPIPVAPLTIVEELVKLRAQVFGPVGSAQRQRRSLVRRLALQQRHQVRAQTGGIRVRTGTPQQGTGQDGTTAAEECAETTNGQGKRRCTGLRVWVRCCCCWLCLFAVCGRTCVTARRAPTRSPGRAETNETSSRRVAAVRGNERDRCRSFCWFGFFEGEKNKSRCRRVRPMIKA